MNKLKTGISDLDLYVDKISKGKILACKWVKLAIERHIEDLRKGEYFFNKENAEKFFNYCENNLSHYEGIMYGEPLKLEPWQFFVYGSIFGWKKNSVIRGKEMELRRFRDADIFVPKKNGKSILSGAVALYMMDSEGDNWPAAQCYILAKNQTHAKELGYRAATIMAEGSKTLKEKFKISSGAATIGIYYKDNNSFYKPITSKPESEDGRNVHFCGPDETKDWTDFEIYEVMKNGTVNAPNSLVMSTTTAGPNLLSLGYVRQKYIERILDGKIEDDNTFGIIYGVDEEDKLKDGKVNDDWWTDPKVWQKANPNYEISVFEDTLKSMVITAKESPSKRTAFQTKHLNIWHSSSEGYIQMGKWQKCGNEKLPPPMLSFKNTLKDFIGLDCYGALDLGSVSDFTAFVLVFRGDNYKIVPFFWIPKDTIADRKGSSVINQWVEEGYIKATEGDWTDHNHIQEEIKEISSIVNITEISYDRYKMDQMVTNLISEGLEMYPFGQGYVSMSPAVDALENYTLQGKIEHYGNPVLSWMLSNVTICKDPAGNRKFDKGKSYEKIDGIVAAAMGLTRADLFEDESTTEWSDIKFI